jgi:nucleoside-diphosphate-sugar epimerase
VAGSTAAADTLVAELAPLGPFQAIIHAAALVRHSRQRGEELFAANVDGTLSMVRLAAQLGTRLVFVSTSGTVGCSLNPRHAPDEAAPYCTETVARWPYYASKIEAEQRARRLADQLGVDLVIVRPPMMLGPGDHRFRSTAQILRILRRKLPFVIDGGIHYIDIRDAAKAMVKAATIATAEPIYHLTGTSTTIRELVDQCAALGGVRPPARSLPYRIAHGLASASAWVGRLATGRPLHLLPDPVVIEMARHHWGLGSRVAERDLGYRSRPGTTTLADTIAWLYAHHPALQSAPRPMGAALDGGAVAREEASSPAMPSGWTPGAAAGLPMSLVHPSAATPYKEA